MAEPATISGRGPILATSCEASPEEMTRQLAMEGSEHGIRVNSVSPGLIESGATRGELADEQWGRAMRDRTLLDRFGQPEDVANVAPSSRPMRAPT